MPPVTDAPAPLSLAPGFDEVQAPVWHGVGRPYVSGEPGGDRLRVRYGFHALERVLLAHAWFGPGAEGPPGHAHGGSIAALLDEAMGTCAWSAGHPVVAAKLEVEFKNLLPLGTVVRVEARVSHVEGRKVRVTGRMTGEDGLLFASAEGLFLELAPERFAGLGLPGR